jgi:signal transduction histidine kinase
MSGQRNFAVIQQNVLVISDETEFARTLTARWQAERHVPAITVVSSDVWHRAQSRGYELVIVGPGGGGAGKSDAAEILAKLGTSTPVICAMQDESSALALQSRFPQMLAVPEQDGWIHTLILLASETLRRVEAVARAQRAERATQESQAYAVLGRYMLDMRPSFNDALTSVLGNADLLLLDAAPLSGDRREQIRTIHIMTLRLNEIMLRFSSLESEMRAEQSVSPSMARERQPSLVTRS